MRKRIATLKMNKKEILYLQEILGMLSRGRRVNKHVEKYFKDLDNDELFSAIDEKVDDACYEFFDERAYLRDMYENTGGYLGDGVYVSRDGVIYHN